MVEEAITNYAYGDIYRACEYGWKVKMKDKSNSEVVSTNLQKKEDLG